MARNFRELESKMSPASRERSDAKYQQLRKDMTLAELREALSLTQTTLAKTLDINQAAVSKIEKRTDIFLSTLRNYIRAMGGELEIRASFPGRQPVIINQFSEVELKKSPDFAKS